MATAYVALGSNVGDRHARLDAALARLSERPGVSVVRRSAACETPAAGGPPDTPPYLNAAAELRTDLSPDDLLATLLAVEAELGRVRTTPNAPRPIDLDLLLYDGLVRSDANLTVPHPRMHERAFVLAPLAEVAPAAVHPVLKRTVRDLLAALSPDRPLTGLRTLVTGSSSGIGRAIATAFAAAGADVIVHARRSREKAEEAADEVRRSGRRSATLFANLADGNECARLADEAWAVWGGLDVCVLNAGADTLTGEAAAWPFGRKLTELLAVDVVSTMTLARDLGERMRQRGGGCLLTTGWDQSETGMEGDSGQLFAATKGAVTCFSRSLALSLAPAVRVNVLAPGWVKTAWGDQASDVWQQRVLRETPLARWGLPADVAAAAVWLASPAAAFVTGQTVRVNGGAVR